MGTYGDFTGLVRWFDPVNKVGHLLALKDGEVQTDITGNYWASGATGYDEGSGFWLDRLPINLVAGSPIGLLLSLTQAASSTSPGTTRLFFGNAAGNKVTWDGTSLNIVGSVTATDGEIGSWTINDVYLARDTGVDATSAGMAPLDYPFYSGATYANRATGKFRVNAAGEMVAEDAFITGTVNFGGGKGVLNSTGFAFDSTATTYVKIDDSAAQLLRVRADNASTYGVLIENRNNAAGAIGLYVAVGDVGTSVGTAIKGYGYDGIGVYGDGIGSNSTGVGVKGFGNKWGVEAYGGVSANPALYAHSLWGAGGYAGKFYGYTRFGNPDTNYAQFDGTGALSLYGTARYERHIQIPAILTGNPANQPTQVDYYTVGGLQFPTTGSKYIFAQWEVPDDWDGGNIYFEVDWLPDSGPTSGTDTVKWTVEYRAIAEGELISQGTSVTMSSTDSGDYSQYQTKHARMTMTYNDANQPLTKQDHVFFKISRDTSVANDFGGTVVATEFEIIYTSTGFPTSN